MKNETKITHNQRGVSSIILLVILSTVFVLMGFVFSFRAVTKLEEAELALDGDRAERAAESGADEALLQLRRDPTYGASQLVIEKDSLGNPKVWSDISVSTPSGGVYTITSVGNANNAIKTLIVTFTKSPTYETLHPVVTKRYFQ